MSKRDPALKYDTHGNVMRDKCGWPVRAHDVDYESGDGGEPPTLCTCGEYLGACYRCGAPIVCDDRECPGCGANMRNM